LGLSGLIDPGQALSVGKLLNAEILVYGSFIVSGTNLRIDLKAVRAETGQVLTTASTSCKTSDAVLVQRGLSEKLALGLGIELAPALPEPVKQEAAKKYYTGLSFLDEGKYAQALELFKSAKDEDPSYSKAGQGIEEAYRYLKDFRLQRYRREMNVLAVKIDALKARIKAPVFYAFVDMVSRPQEYGFCDPEAASAAYQANPEVYAGETPVQAIWGLQNLYVDLRSKALEYFDDQPLNAYCSAQILQWADIAEKYYPKDPFLPEVLYNRFFVLRDYGKWQQVRDLCETIMGKYPDYRMIWAVEGFYEEALESLDS
jgi:tetratricopeptide (TPR) repeat protein